MTRIHSGNEVNHKFKVFTAYLFLIGNCLVWYLTSELYWQIFLLTLTLPLLVIYRSSKIALILLPLILGGIFSEFHAFNQQWKFPEHLVADNHRITGVIEGLPENKGDIVRLRFRVLTINGEELTNWQALNFRLACYRSCANYRADQQWQLLVRLKPNNGYANPMGFDYEKWLYSTKIKATGYIVPSKMNQLIATHRDIDSLRETVRDYVLEHVKDDNQSAIRGSILALALGDKSKLETRHQQMLAANGLSHLMAISGLHIGLSAIPGFLLAGFIWGRIRTFQRFNRILFKWTLCLMPAICYTALSGFGIPAMRSLLMLLVFASVQLMRNNLSIHSRFTTALMIILLLQPLAPLQVSFWLSFAATAILLYLSSFKQPSNKFLQLFKLQSQLFILLLPLQLLVFGKVSLLSPLINFVAIPFVSIILLPLILLEVVLILFTSYLGEILQTEVALYFYAFLTQTTEFVLLLIISLLNEFWQILEELKPLTKSSQMVLTDFTLVYLLLYPLLAILMMSIKKRIKIIVLLLILMPLLINLKSINLKIINLKKSGANADKLIMTVLDVGQGLALTLEYADKLLVYDTGYGSRDFKVATMTLEPWLDILSTKTISLLMISHNDIDHSGGLSTLLQSRAIEQLVIGPDVAIPKLDELQKIAISRCHNGQHWQWGELALNVLAPELNDTLLTHGNNSSCVLQLTFKGKSLLLTGDIEKLAEARLLMNHPNLTADVLLVPHHGSKTSSTNPLLMQLKPNLAIISSGYLNRFNLPAEKIVKRYQKQGVLIYNTAYSGAVQIIIDKESQIHIKQWRVKNANLWRRH